MKTLVLLILATATWAAGPTLEIKVDQVGYLNSAAKLALVVSKKPATAFTVNQAKDGKVVSRGTLSAPADDYDSGDRVQTADFSKWTRPGTYYIEVPEVGRSWDFEIGPDVYAKTWRLAMRAYYGQRCGIAVDLAPDFPGYKHDACHLEGAFHPSSGKSGPHASKGGWHDAGDYGRYMVDSGITTGTLLWAYEMYGPHLKGVNLNIPESGNGQPDMLNEARWNLDWMLSMQDDDGGVWAKQTSEKFADFVMPEMDKLASLVIGTGKDPYKSSCATGDFAAVMAIAGRVYQPFNPAFGNKSLKAAQKAWDWLEKNPDVTFRNPPGITTGDYYAATCGGEHLWAAAELFRSTGEPRYSRYFLDHYASFMKAPDETVAPSWLNVGPLGLWTYAMAKGADSGAANSIRRNIIGAADEIANRSANNRYRITLSHGDYIWGSNGLVANYGMELLIASALTHNARYTEAALDDLHYLLGRNTFSLSFVTRVGENPVRHPHHRPSIADRLDEPWPGLLVGGPNHDRQDPLMSKMSSDLAPAQIYLDDKDAYSVNEVAINWNAPLVFSLAGAQELAEGPAPSGRSRSAQERGR